MSKKIEVKEIINPFKKTLEFDNEKSWAKVYIEYDESGRLSISGDWREYGRHGGGSGGQCQDSILEAFPESKRLVEIWNEWHLNDMNAGCTHSDEWDREKELTIYEFSRRSQVSDELKEAERIAIEAAKKGVRANLTPYQKKLFDMPYFLKSVYMTPPEGYKSYKKHTERAGWTSAQDHPEGLLGKECPTCGVKYGSSWYFREVPSSVLRELEEME